MARGPRYHGPMSKLAPLFLALQLLLLTGSVLAQDHDDLLEASGELENADAHSTDRGHTRQMTFDRGVLIDHRGETMSLLYFRDRLRAEFDSPRMPHRTFVPELQRSSHGATF